MIELSVYAGLFLAALLAATVLPMQSEALLVGLLLTGDYPVAIPDSVAKKSLLTKKDFEETYGEGAADEAGTQAILAGLRQISQRYTRPGAGA